MPRPTPSPIDLPGEPVRGAGLRWTATAISVATLILLAGNAVSLRDWADDLSPSPAQARVADLAQDWLSLTEATGLAAPRAWLHGVWKRLEAARFEGQPAAE